MELLTAPDPIIPASTTACCSGPDVTFCGMWMAWAEPLRDLTRFRFAIVAACDDHFVDAQQAIIDRTCADAGVKQAEVLGRAEQADTFDEAAAWVIAETKAIERMTGEPWVSPMPTRQDCLAWQSVLG